MIDISTSIIHIQDDANEKKVFQCRRYGNCRMIFTRSEHLARHERKHTGEKPFNCILPSCKRKFSRFDNMMQHTQTHHSSPTSDKVPDLVKSKPSLKRRRTSTKKTTTTTTTNKKKTTTTTNNKKKKKTTVDLCKLSHDNHMTMLMDELFLLSDSSLLTSDEEDFEDNEIIIDVDDSLLAATTTSKIGHMILPHLANYLVDHPDEPPENYFFRYYHRLSKQDLAYPIESLLLAASHQGNNEGGVYITIDEYEALQGLSRFYTTTCQK